MCYTRYAVEPEVAKADAYRMFFERGLGYQRAGHVWNIHTDNSVIGFVDDGQSLNATHNGYVSTNWARLTTELLFAEDKTYTGPRINPPQP